MVVAQLRGFENNGATFLTSPLVVKAQEVENFTCVFSECAGEDIVCNCSVPDDPLSGGMATVAFVALPFYMTAILQEMNPMWLQKWLPLVPLVALPPN